LYLWLFRCADLVDDFVEVFHGAFDDSDAAEEKLLELARLRSRILVAVLLVNAAEVTAKDRKEVVVRLDAHWELCRAADLASTKFLPQGTPSMWLAVLLDANMASAMEPHEKFAMRTSSLDRRGSARRGACRFSVMNVIRHIVTLVKLSNPEQKQLPRDTSDANEASMGELEFVWRRPPPTR